MANKVWVYIDHFKGNAVLTSWEAVGAAKALAGQTPGAHDCSQSSRVPNQWQHRGGQVARRH